LNNYKIIKKTNNEVIALRAEYLKSLIAPIDGMWSVFVEMADQYIFTINDISIGYCSINGENQILQFFVKMGYDADEIYRQILNELSISGAVVSTQEHQHLSLAIDRHKSLAVNAFLYQCEDNVAVMNADFNKNMNFRRIKLCELQSAIDLAVSALGAPEDWLNGYYRERIEGCELIGLWQGDKLIATGECRPSSTQKPYADLGMVVSSEYRGKGIATKILRSMILECREHGLIPICSTESENFAARKAIENSGFKSQLRILAVSY
jgi:GNAT superfamily N-acetyltransferase